MYSLWIKIDETLPWIELGDVYATKKEACREARNLIQKIQTKTVKLPAKGKQLKSLAAISR